MAKSFVLCILLVLFQFIVLFCNTTEAISSAIDVINDNYCDLADGSDETLTSACSYLPVKFTCSDGKLLFTSRVNDGVCDCCDGGDEYDSPIPLKCTIMCDGAATKHSILFGSSHMTIQYPLTKEQSSLVTSSVKQSHNEHEAEIIESVKEQTDNHDAVDSSIPLSNRFTIKLDKQKILQANRLAKKSQQHDSSKWWLLIGGLLIAMLVYTIRSRCLRNSSGAILATYNNYGEGDPIYLHGHQRSERGYAGTLQTVSFFVSGLVRTACLRASQCCSREGLGALWSSKPNAHTV